MRRVQWVLFVLSGIVAMSVILSAQLWTSSVSGLTTTGTVSITSGTTSALAVTGGADVGGVIQAGSGNVNITNSTGNLLPAALASGTISTAQTFTGVTTMQASSPHIVIAPSGGVWAQWRGRLSDDAGILQMTNNAGTTEQARLTWTNTPALTISGGAGGTTGIIVGNTAVSWAGVRLNSSPVQPGFLAYIDANVNLTIAGLATLEFGVENYDSGVFATPTFTAPVAGIYDICVQITASTSTGLATWQVTTSSGIDAILGSSDTLSSPVRVRQACMPLSLAASETVSIQTTVSGGQTVTVFGGAGLVSWFSARLRP